MNKINKPWGYEVIIEHNEKYVMKKLKMNKGHKCSIQYHEKKKETVYVLSGKLKVYIGDKMTNLEEIILEIDELESLRLADFLALSHEQAASQMIISRATFGRIIEIARKKIVDAILNGKAIKICDEIPETLKIKTIEKCSKCKS